MDPAVPTTRSTTRPALPGSATRHAANASADVRRGTKASPVPHRPLLALRFGGAPKARAAELAFAPDKKKSAAAGKQQGAGQKAAGNGKRKR